jgi:hypothetical protein
MLSLDAFLARILPSSGDIVVVEMTPAGLIHYAFTSIPQAAAKIRALEQKRANIYIALAGFKPGTVKRSKGRTHENATNFRSLWLDLDVGLNDAKKYPTRRAAATALENFVNATGLPYPLVVSSGGGLHVYWPFDADADQPTWKPLALALKSLCLTYGLKIDVRCTADAARILRPVETSNWKTGAPRPVKVKKDAAALSIDSLRAALNVHASSATAIPQGNGHADVNSPFALTSIDKATPDQFDGAKILAGCQQMQWAMHNQNDVHYDMWRMLIGTLFKSDAPHLIHEVSKDYTKDTGYDYDFTEEKARDWKGTGALCKKLEEFNAGGCDGCPHKGTIKSPSAIGFSSAPAPEVRIDPITSMPQGWSYKNGTLWVTHDEGSVEIYKGTIEVGDPYMDRSNFGAQRTLVPLATTMNGSRTEGYIDYAMISSPVELYKSLTSCGIVFEQRHFKNAMTAIRAWMQVVRTKAVVAPARRQLGWNSTAMYDNDTSFILGENSYHADGTSAHIRLSETIKSFGRDIHTHGTLEEWQQAFNLLGMPGYEAHMVMSWIAFGAPLIRLDATPPAMIHAYSQTSSQGKTTVLHLINSVYGDPNGASLSWSANSTPNSIQTALSVLNGIPMGVDEITRLEPEDQHRLLYECTQQMGRKRLKQDGTLQESVMTKTMLYSTGNTSLQNVAAIATSQLDDTPIQARLGEIELLFPPMTPVERSERRILVESVKSHFGHAAPVYIAWMVRNQDKATQLLASVRHKLETATLATNIERFQISSFSAMITGALIARKLGLINHPVERGIEWIVEWFDEHRAEQAISANTPVVLLERMINDFQLHTLTVDRDEPMVVSISAPKLVDTLKHPIRELYARFALEEQKFYIIAIKVKHWLVKHQLNVKATLDDWHQAGLLESTDYSINKLGRYTKHNIERQRCYIFDLSKLDEIPDILTTQ